ncbi:hypothetical protein OPV22_025685 [Ensete ventricosum]|uniref:DUF676 domain-containing protein n=1 Tax=Ensete ventricosum TaxID=4639 RepID=A0AAV8QG68_ENSVE|nr:hypothetical protein OPV22_025685 [Ensete ventricosum]
MWGEGGRFYWGRTEGEQQREVKGIAVLFAWISSQESHLKPFIDLYWSLGWSPLVCHVDFLTLFFADKATSLACGILDELLKVIKIRQLPIVFMSFSLGSKGCLYKVLQILDGKWQKGLKLLIRECICGQIYDSSPVDFTAELATRFLHHTSQRFEAQCAEYWQSLYSSVSMGPFLIFCSEDDDLASYQIIFNFSQHLNDLGGDVRLVKWSNSPHVGHYSHHQTDYHSNLVELLGKAATVFSERRVFNWGTANRRSSCGGMLESSCSLHEALSSSESLRRVAIRSNDHFCLPSSSGKLEVKDGSSLSLHEPQKPNLFPSPSINPHGYLSQILFDVCVPKNVEGWDVKPITINGKQSSVSARPPPNLDIGLSQTHTAWACGSEINGLDPLSVSPPRLPCIQTALQENPEKDAIASRPFQRPTTSSGPLSLPPSLFLFFSLWKEGEVREVSLLSLVSS